MTENLITQAREIVCPDGTQYQVFSDGTWIHETWDGQFVRSSMRDDNSTDPAEVVAKLGL
jgi:hypothetical protein